MIGKKQYKTQQFTVTVENHRDYKGFKWVRIYANAWSVEYLAESRILLSCTSGTDSILTLFKDARLLAMAKLKNYQERAQAILDLTM